MSRTGVEPRIAERRRRVREEGAREVVRRLVRLLVAAAVMAGVVWSLQSPWLSVQRIEVDGVRRADLEGALEEAGVGVGVPTAMIRAFRANRLETALEDDPWVGAAEVRVVFPTTVEVAVEERIPVALVAGSSGRWMLVSADGTVLAEADREGDRPRVGVEVDAVPGDRLEDGEVLGAVEFLGALGEPLGAGATVSREDGELWAVVAGHRVRLGRPTEMMAKASALAALLEVGLEEGAVVDLLTPSRPAVVEPSM